MPVDPLLRKRAAISATRRRPTAVTPTDRTLADLPRWVEKVEALPDIRWDKVAAIREALVAGQYDVDTRCQDMLDHPPDGLAILGDWQV